MSHRVTTPPSEPPMPDGSKVGGWWHESSDAARLICDLCPRGCSLRPGDRGFCFVRENRDGRIVSTTYGRSTGFCVDPIEKKPLNHFYPGTPVLSFGTAGCNLGCRFCQNWTSSRSHDVRAACAQAAPEAIATAAVELGCRSVAYTYNDPVIFAEYAIDTARACRAAGVRNVVVTSGYITDTARADFFKSIDAANVDLKAFSDEFYREFCAARLQPVLDTLEWLVHHSDVWLEITTLLIPGANDSPEEIERLCRWVYDALGPDVPLHFSAFHPDFKVVDRPPTPPATLTMAHDTARRVGLRYPFTGNVSDPDRQSSYCPGCGKTVIRRDGYRLGTYAVRGGRCRHCEGPIAGRFDDEPGDWGGRRQPVRIEDFAKRPPNNNRVTGREPMLRRGDHVSSCANDQPPPPAPNTARPALSEEHQRQVFRAACARVAATVHGNPTAALEPLPLEVAGMPLYGAFVSLKRAGQLRSCCGYLAQSLPLSEALDRAAQRSANEDPRFPPISATELEHLDVEVWLLWNLQPVSARGESRADAIEIGRHGLQIARGNARGLLLPGVAVDHGLDARGFLQQVCLKAGLPTDVWLADDTTLMTFEGYAITGSMEQAEPPAAVPAAAPGPSPGELSALAEFARNNLAAMTLGATPSYYMPGGYDASVNGLAIAVTPSGGRDAVEVSRLALRPEVPLQSTLFGLIEAAAKALQRQGVPADAIPWAKVNVGVLFDPAMHGTAERPELSGVDTQHRAVLVYDGSRIAWVFDPAKTPDELLAEGLEAAGIAEPARARVLSLAAACSGARMRAVDVPRPQSGPRVRPAAVAGAFYPGTPAEIDRMLDEMLPPHRNQQPWPAAMVPHAGWRYSGRLAAEVLSRVEIPDRVIVLAPKHRPGGSEWAVAPHAAWSLPGGELPSDPELAARLAEGIKGLQLDAASHCQEHAIEVQLPILARLAPHCRVIGIALGGGDSKALQQFGRQLAEVLRHDRPRPLLVISSDMNHFADEAETRRIDRLALKALETLDPEQLYRTVIEKRISMCGMRPAVAVMETLRTWGCLSRIEEVGYATSADASGDTARVVGYAGLLFG